MTQEWGGTMNDIPLPVIDPQLCTGCGICVALCPTGALAQEEQRAVLAAPDRCTYCRACEESCPEDAIALPFLIVFAGRRISQRGESDEPRRL